MKNLSKLLIIPFLAVFIMIGNAAAENITIYDNLGYTGTGQAGEDSETEPGMINTQVWDLEGFFLDGNTLSIVGGWDFLNGVSGYDYESGDIFIDITGDAQYGGDQDLDIDNFGYEYVFDVNWAVGTYNVYSLNSASILTETAENSTESDPYRLFSGGTFVTNGTFSYVTGLTNEGTGFSGGDHFMADGFDLSFLGEGQDITAHFTIECGNDNLMGSGTTPIPEPASMLLLGTGLIGMAGIGRKKFNKS